LKEYRKEPSKVGDLDLMTPKRRGADRVMAKLKKWSDHGSNVVQVLSVPAREFDRLSWTSGF